MPYIPAKYAQKGVLYEILIIAIRDNWPRIKDYYEDVLNWVDLSGTADIDIDRKMLTQFRKDIKRDGWQFIETPDGVGSRLREWLIEAFPYVFN